MLRRYNSFIKENKEEEFEEYEDFIIEYLEEKWTKDRMNDYFEERVYDYMDENDVEYGETTRGAYTRLSNGDIEFELISKIGKDICEVFELPEDDFYMSELDILISKYLIKNLSWCNKNLFDYHCSAFQDWVKKESNEYRSMG